VRPSAGVAAIQRTGNSLTCTKRNSSGTATLRKIAQIKYVFEKKTFAKFASRSTLWMFAPFALKIVLALSTSRLSLTPDSQDRDLGGMVERRGVNRRTTVARVWVAGEIFRDWDQRFYLQVSIRA